MRSFAMLALVGAASAIPVSHELHELLEKGAHDALNAIPAGVHHELAQFHDELPSHSQLAELYHAAPSAKLFEHEMEAFFKEPSTLAALNTLANNLQAKAPNTYDMAAKGADTFSDMGRHAAHLAPKVASFVQHKETQEQAMSLYHKAAHYYSRKGELFKHAHALFNVLKPSALSHLREFGKENEAELHAHAHELFGKEGVQKLAEAMHKL